MIRAARSASLLYTGTALTILSLACMATPHAADVPEQGGTLAQEILKTAGVKGGLIVHVGCGDGQLTGVLRAGDSFLVHGLDRKAENVEAARRQIQSLGLYGPISAGHWTGGGLPYPDNFVNLLVLGHDCQVPEDEILRVLEPGGAAISADRQSRIHGPALVKPWPVGMDQWTHHLHGPDGNPVAKDRLVGPPRHFQWLSEPPWQRCHDTDSSISAVVTAGGRIFYIEDQAPISTVGQHGLPDRWFLVARDAMNGVPLWKRTIEHWGWREWKKTWFQGRHGMIPLNLPRRLVAVGDHVYVTLGYHAPVSQLDAASGRSVQTYQGTENANEILCQDGALILSVNRDGKLKVVALDAKSGQIRWETQPVFRGTTNEELRWGERFGSVQPPKLDPAANLSTDGRVICLIDGPELVCLGFQTGTECWRAKPVEPPKRGKAKEAVKTDLMVGTVIVTDKAVLYADPRELVSLSKADGKKLWSRGRQGLGFYSWKDVFVIQGLAWTWSVESESAVYGKDADGKRELRSRWPLLVNGYDLLTGEVRKQVDLCNVFKAPHHHRCYQNKATERFIVASRRGSEFVDLEAGRHSVNNWVRGTCHPTPARVVNADGLNLLQYAELWLVSA